MKTTNWLNLDLHEYVAIDLEDGRRIELAKGDKLIMSVDSICVQQQNGEATIFPAIKVSHILKKFKSRLIK